MKRYACRAISLALCVLLAACSGNNSQKGTSTVTITAGGTTTQNTAVPQAARRAAARLFSADARVSLVQKLVFTISGPGMNEISREVSFSPLVAVTEEFEVPTGAARHFVVEGRDSGGTTQYRGSATGDLDGHKVTLALLMMPTFFMGTVQAGTPGNDEGSGIARDVDGNLYIVGNTYGLMSAASNSNAGYSDVFVTKYDKTGLWQWSSQLGTAGPDFGYGITVDSRGNAYVTGGTPTGLDGNTSNGGVDAFVVKFDTDGRKLWTRQLGTAGNDFGTRIADDKNGSLYITGYTDGAFTGFTNAGLYDAFVIKLASATGATQWTQQFGSAGNDDGSGLAVDAAGSVYAAGYTDGDLGGTNAGWTDVFAVKLDPATGALLWKRQFGSSESEDLSGLAVDGSGNLYLVGSTYGDLVANGNADATFMTSDAYVVKYGADGTRVWTKQFGTTVNDWATGVAVDGSGNIYVSGNTFGILGTENAGAIDFFLTKFDPTGTKAWTSQLGTSLDDLATGLTVDSSGNAWLTGSTGSGLDGNISIGGTDMFLVMYDTSGVKQ